MTSTDFFVAVSGEQERAAPFGSACRFISNDEQSLIKEVISQSAESILVLAFVEDKCVGKALCKAMFSFFAESINPSKDVYTQFKVSFVEEKANDLIQYRCERLGDIDAVIEAEDGAHDCSSICATNVVPNEASFLFVERRLTVMVCTAAEYNADKLLRITENAAVMVGCCVTSVGFYIPKEVMCSCINLEELAKEGERFKEVVARRSIGHEERVSSRVRLQDVRAWSLMINEKNHFSAVEPGPYFVSLNSQLVVGEKLAHYIPEERTYIVGESTNASPVDFCVMPPVADDDALHRSVYSPHCRLRREGYAVYLKPECGMTYLNGKLIAEEQLLQHNDRIILGKQLAFRFVMIGTEVPKSPDSRILDWELCSKEFRRENERAVESGTQAALEQSNSELRARCEELSGLLDSTRGDSWLVLTNPPTTYKGQWMWPFDLRKRHSQLTIGPQGDVALPFLTTSAMLKHAMDGLVYKSGNMTISISNGSRFNVGAFTFAVSIDEGIAPGRMRKEATLDTSVSADAMRELQSSFFSLQWSVGALFDFVFPVKGRKVKKEDDKYFAYRAPLYDTHLLEASAVHTPDIVALNAQLTTALRLMGAGLAKEMQELAVLQPSSKTASTELSPRGAGTDAVAFAKAEDFLRSVEADTALTTAVMRQVHHDIGTVLYERCNGQEPAVQLSPTVKSARTAGGGSSAKEHLREASPSPSPSIAGYNAEAKLFQLKGMCFLSSPQVVQRASNTVDLLNISTNAKALWERHVQHVSTIGKAFTQKKGEDANLLTELLLLIVDAVLSTDYCMRRRLLSPSELESLEPKLTLWQKWAKKCIGVMDGQMHFSRATWKHEAAVQRKPTPHIHRRSAKKRGDSTALNRGSTTGPGGLDGSTGGVGSRKASLSRTTLGYTSAPPRLTDNRHSSGRAALSTTYSGKTPHNLSSFATLRKASVSSATNMQSARGSRSSARRSSSSAALDKSGRDTSVKKRSPSTGSRSAAPVSTAVTGRRKLEGSVQKKKKPTTSV
jgi:hypothetical protein